MIHSMNSLTNIQDEAAYKPAGFWMRVATLIVDYMFFSFGAGVLILAIALLVIALTPVTFQQVAEFSQQMEEISDPDVPTDHLRGSFVYIVTILQGPLYIVGTIIYQSVAEASKLRASPGKFVLRLVVLRHAGEPHTLGRALLRNSFAWMLGIMTLSMSHWVAGFTKEKRALHDYITGCKVVARV